jgi:quercetin dioxygenase-like cupin family protein
VTQPVAPVTGSVISDPDAQTAILFLGALSQVRVSGAQTGGAFAVADHLARRGNASPVQVHDWDDETFFVLDGELRVFAAGGEHVAGPGADAVLPWHVPREVRVAADLPKGPTGKMLTRELRAG